MAGTRGKGIAVLLLQPVSAIIQAAEFEIMFTLTMGIVVFVLRQLLVSCLISGKRTFGTVVCKCLMAAATWMIRLDYNGFVGSNTTYSLGNALHASWNLYRTLICDFPGFIFMGCDRTNCAKLPLELSNGQGINPSPSYLYCEYWFHEVQKNCVLAAWWTDN